MDNTKILTKHYHTKVHNAKRQVDKLGNPIQFLITLDQYIDIFNRAGVTPSRKYCLSRIDTTGGYMINNVRVNHSMDVAMANCGYTLSEDDDIITKYSIARKYKRKIITNAIKRGALTIEHIRDYVKMNPIKVLH